MSEESQRTEEIRRRMQFLRTELHQDVREVVASTRDMTDWKTYVRRYPWAVVGLAAGVGFLIVPAKVRREVVQPSDKQILKLAKEDRIHINTEARSPKNATILSTALTFAANAALRAGMAYAGQQLGRMMQAQATGVASTGDLVDAFPSKGAS